VITKQSQRKWGQGDGEPSRTGRVTP
jgi:hypothetical protein